MDSKSDQRKQTGFLSGSAFGLNLLVLAAIFFQAACGRQPNTTEPGASTSQPGAASPVAPDEELDLDDGNVVVTFATSVYDRTIYDPLVEEFNAQNDSIQVQFVELPEYNPDTDGENYNYLRNLAVAADTSIVYTSDPQSAYYFRDIQPLIEADPSLDIDDFWSGALLGCQDPEGRTLGLPLRTQLNVIFYDEAAFREAGVPEPGPGWTYDDFQKAAQALGRKEGGTTRYGFAEQSYLWGSILAPVIDAHLQENDGQPDAEALNKSLQWYFDLARSDSILPIKETEQDRDWWQDWENMFKTEQRPAMFLGELSLHMPGVDWSYEAGNALLGTALEKMGVAPYPIAADGSVENTSPLYTECIGISSGSNHPRAAWTWLEFLSRQRLLRNQSDAYEVLRIPARQSVTDESGFWETIPDKAEATIRFGLEHGWPGTIYAQAFEAVNEAIRKTTAGKGNFTEVLDTKHAELIRTPTSTPDTAAIVVATPRPTLSANMTGIKYFASVYGSEKEALKKQIEAYQKEHPDTVIQLETEINWAMPDGGDPILQMPEKYDCFSWYSLYFPEGSNPGLLNLNSLFQAEGASFTQDFSTNMLDSFRFEGDLYGLPAYSKPQVIAYNKDLLKKRGLQLPAEDWTYDDFMKLMSGVASTDSADPSYGYMYNGYEDFLFAGRGVTAFDRYQDPPVPNFDSPEMVNAMIWLQDLAKSNTVLVQDQDNWMTVQDAYTKGQLGFWLAQAGSENQFYAGPGSESPFEIGVAPMPAMPESAIINYYSSDSGYFVSEKSEQIQACWDWIKYLSLQPNAYQGVPARRSVSESQAWAAMIGPEKASAYRAAVAAVKAPAQRTESKIVWPLYNWQQQVLNAVLKGEDPQLLLSDAQKNAEAYLACMATVDLSKLEDEALYQQMSTCAKQVDPDGNW